MRKADGDNVIVISSLKSADKALSNYCLRWQIETLFGCLKTRGFGLEETHITSPERVSRLLTLLALGFCQRVINWQSYLRAKSVANKETQKIGAIAVSSGLGLFGASLWASRRQRTKAGKATTYLTFVPYLDKIINNLWLDFSRQNRTVDLLCRIKTTIFYLG